MTREPDHRRRRIARGLRRGAPAPREQLELPFDLSDVRPWLADEEALREAVRLSIEGRGTADLTVANIERAIAAVRASGPAREAPITRGVSNPRERAGSDASTDDAGAETAHEIDQERRENWGLSW